MSWLFSQVLVGEYLGDTYLDGEQFVQLNGKNTQQAYCAPDKMTKFSRLSRYGMMFKPLTEEAGTELLMSFQAGFRAKIFQPLEKELELGGGVAECGNTWPELFAKLSQDMFMWKTPPCLLQEESILSLKTWPQSGTMRNGECFQRPKLAHPILEKESGLLPNGVNFFHTPNTTGMDGGSNSRKALKKRMEWPTPDANMGNRGTQPKWTAKRKSGHPAQYSLNQAVRDKFPTPTAHNAKECNSPSESNRNTPTLATHAGGQLNPMWVEWLMGWPIGWTDLKPLETDKCHFVPQ